VTGHPPDLRGATQIVAVAVAVDHDSDRRLSGGKFRIDHDTEQCAARDAERVAGDLHRRVQAGQHAGEGEGEHDRLTPAVSDAGKRRPRAVNATRTVHSDTLTVPSTTRVAVSNSRS